MAGGEDAAATIKGAANGAAAAVAVFKEQLPPNCPPVDATGIDNQIVLRLVAADPCCANDFKSQSALGLQCPNRVNPCEWSSCSMLLPATKPEKIKDMLSFPRLKNMKFLAHVKVTNASGKAVIAGTHVHLWMYQTFDPMAATVKLEPIP